METNEHALLQNLLNQLWDAGFRPFAGMPSLHGSGCYDQQKTRPHMDAEAQSLELLIRSIARQEVERVLLSCAEIGLMTK